MKQLLFLLFSSVIFFSTPAYSNLRLEVKGRIQNLSSLDVFVQGKYAYVTGWDGFHIIDISDPQNPRLVSSLTTPYLPAKRLFVFESYAYVADGGKLLIINIEDPSNPHIVSTVDINPDFFSNEGLLWVGYVEDVYVSSSFAYVANGGQGISIIDISNPRTPRIVGSAPSDYAVGVYVSNNYLYVVGNTLTSSSGALTIMEIENPEHPNLLGHILTSGDAKDVYVSGNYAYVANGLSGLQIIDVKNPAKPSIVGNYDRFFETVEGVYVSGSHAYLAKGWGGLEVINIDNPSDPATVAEIETPGSAQSVYVSGSYAYVADRDDFLIVEIQDIHGQQADVKINGLDGPTRFSPNDRLNITLFLYFEGSPKTGDYFLWAKMPDGDCYCYLYPELWHPCACDSPSPAYQGTWLPLSNFPADSIPCLNIPRGRYILYFAVDDHLNNRLDSNPLQDSISFEID